MPILIPQVGLLMDMPLQNGVHNNPNSYPFEESGAVEYLDGSFRLKPATSIEWQDDDTGDLTYTDKDQSMWIRWKFQGSTPVNGVYADIWCGRSSPRFGIKIERALGIMRVEYTLGTDGSGEVTENWPSGADFDNDWHTTVLMWDEASELLYMYHDADQKFLEDYSGEGPLMEDIENAIDSGTANGTTDNQLLIDRWCVWDRLLSEAEISALHSGSSSGNDEVDDCDIALGLGI